MKCKTQGCNREDIKNNELGLCSIHYARWYRRQDENRPRLAKQGKIRHLINKEKHNNQMKEWRKNHPEYNRNRMKKRYVEERELNEIRKLTRKKFQHLKENGQCQDCGKKGKGLEFHHLVPYSADNFRLLCFDCHRKAHEKILLEMEEKTNG